MLPEEQARVLSFLLAVASVYALAIVLSLRAFRARRSPASRSRSERAAWHLSLAGALVGLLCGAYGLWIEPYWPSVEHVRITSAKLKRGERVRIVHLSDVHSDPVARLELELPALISAQKPDLIVFTGDAINSPEGLPVFRRLLTSLSSIAPLLVVRGNWDVWYWSALDLFGATGAQELANTVASVPVRGRQVWIAGLSVERERELPRLLSTLPHEDLRILLHHYPDQAYVAANHGVDLYLAGHTHGGQVALPWYGALVTFSRFGKRFESGLHAVGNMQLYVTRGIGMEGGAAPRVRFAARPEITVLHLAGR